MNIRELIVLAAAAGLLSATAVAHDGKDHDAPAAQGPAVATVDGSGTRDALAYFTDTVLLNQDGESVRFYSDVLKDRVVLINVIYTDCADACPLITRKINEVREALGDEFERRVHFISISSDPERDSPQALKTFAQENDADAPNWTFLSGDKANVDFVLGRLGQLSETPEGHSTLLIAGDVANKRWSKIRPDAPPVAVAERLKLLTIPIGER